MSSQYSPLSISITKKLDKTIKKQEGIYFTPPKTIENNIKLLSPYIDNIKNIIFPLKFAADLVKSQGLSECI